MTKRILLLDRNSSLFIKLVRPQKAENGVLVVSQNHITRGIQFHKNVVGILALTEGDVYHSVDAQLLDALALLRPQMLPKFHGKA